MSTESYKSALELASLALYSGDLEVVRCKIEAQLNDLGIDFSNSIDNLPDGQSDHREAIVRLISLARGNGLFIVLEPPVVGESINITISAPNRDAGQLQSGHH